MFASSQETACDCMLAKLNVDRMQSAFVG